MDREEISILAGACCNDSECAVLRRPYAMAWGPERAAVDRLERKGFLAFESSHRQHDGTFIRRSKITEAGREALRASAPRQPA